MVLSILLLTAELLYTGMSIQSCMRCSLLSSFATAFGASCKTEPTEFSYKDSSVIRLVRSNCMRYASTDNNGDNVDTTQYIHCHGNKLLTDSIIGPSQYDSSKTRLYTWTSTNSQRLLFVFPTTTSLTMITLHYYSGYYQGSHRAGLPRLRFYAVHCKNKGG